MAHKMIFKCYTLNNLRNLLIIEYISSNIILDTERAHFSFSLCFFPLYFFRSSNEKENPTDCIVALDLFRLRTFKPLSFPNLYLHISWILPRNHQCTK